MQKYAVGLEQIVWDQEDLQLEFRKQFKETEYKLRTVNSFFFLFLSLSILFQYLLANHFLFRVLPFIPAVKERKKKEKRKEKEKNY